MSRQTGWELVAITYSRSRIDAFKSDPEHKPLPYGLVSHKPSKDPDAEREIANRERPERDTSAAASDGFAEPGACGQR